MPSLPTDSSPSSRAPTSEVAAAGLLNTPYVVPRRSQSSGRSSAYAPTRSAALRDQILHAADKLQRKTMSTVQRMTPLQRILAAVAIVSAATTGVLFLIFNERVFGWLEPYAERWKHTTGGWVILWALTFLTAFPPVIGYSACGTTAGFVYGVWEGWLVYASATVAGSFCSFIVSRTVLRRYVERMVANDKRFAALTLTLKEDGLKLLCMIRLCPLPYSLSNGAMSTFPSVPPSQYALATALISPKLLIHVFIGSRLAAIAKKKEEMSAGTKALNWASIIGFGLLGAFMGWYIYGKTMQRARQLEEEEQANVRETNRRTGAPPPEFFDDPEAQMAATTLARGDNADAGEGDDDFAYFDDEPELHPYRDEEQQQHHLDQDDVFGKDDTTR